MLFCQLPCRYASVFRAISLRVDALFDDIYAMLPRLYFRR